MECRNNHFVELMTVTSSTDSPRDSRPAVARYSRVEGVLIVVCVLFFISIPTLEGGEVTLRDGTTIKGKIVPMETVGLRASKPDPDRMPNMSIIMVEESGAVRIHVPRLQVTNLNKEVDLLGSERFRLPQERRSRTRVIAEVGGQIEETPFDVHGHRRVSFNVGSKKVDLMQEIIEVEPKYLRVSAMDYLWEFGLPTSSLPPELLDKILHESVKRENSEDRLAIARFYIQGEFYQLAQLELQRIQQEFPELAMQVAALQVQLNQFLAEQALNMLEMRREAGQFRYALEMSRKLEALNLPDIGAALQTRIRETILKSEEEHNKIEDAKQLLGQIQSELPKELIDEISPIRTRIAESLDPDTLTRLASFLELADAEGQAPGEKMALAISGWVLGADQAITDLKQALRLWAAQKLVLSYLQAETSTERADIREKLEAMEGIGPSQVVRILPYVPAESFTPDIKPTVTTTLQVPKKIDSEKQIQYDIMLPPEYHEGRTYPLLVVLHGGEMSCESEIRLWGSSVARLGYIIIAPEFASPNQREYHFGVDAHQAVLESIRDVKRRFWIDSDRIFLGGHGMGADATFDIGYSHPDLFAGIVAVSGVCEKFSHDYRDNARHLPQLILSGELDRNALERNAQDFDHMMQSNFPIIYAVFVGRGHESFQSEASRIFAWMGRQRRVSPPRQLEYKTTRIEDNRCWWWTFSNFPPRFGITAWPKDVKGQNKPITLSCTASKAKGANVINLTSGARYHALWLFPDVVSFESKLEIRQSGTQLHSGIPKADISAMLEDFRLRGDRQQIAWGYLEVGSQATRRPGISTNDARRSRAERISQRNR